MDKKIYLSDYFWKLIVTRNAMVGLFKILEDIPEKKIILDFNKIEFMSRSCTDEYIKRKSGCEKKIKEINTSRNIMTMFLLVARQNKLNNKIITQ